MFAKALVILASISAAFAYPEIIEPVATTTLQGGQSSLIRWRDNGTDLGRFGNASIGIYVGNVNQQTRLQLISPSFNVSSATELAFAPNPTIGPSTTDSREYFIRMESLSLTIGSYPAMVFSAKFGLTGMTGQFSSAILDQIKGQTSAALPASTGSRVASPSSPPVSTSTPKLSSASPSATRAASAADSIVVHGSWIGFLLSAFVGVMI